MLTVLGHVCSCTVVDATSRQSAGTQTHGAVHSVVLRISTFKHAADRGYLWGRPGVCLETVDSELKMCWTGVQVPASGVRRMHAVLGRCPPEVACPLVNDTSSSAWPPAAVFNPACISTCPMCGCGKPCRDGAAFKSCCWLVSDGCASPHLLSFCSTDCCIKSKHAFASSAHTSLVQLTMLHCCSMLCNRYPN